MVMLMPRAREPNVTALCRVCDKEIVVHANRWRRGRGKFCSWRHRRLGLMNTRSKLTFAQVCEIRERYVPRKVTQNQLAREYGIAPRNIWGIVHFKTWVKK